MSQPSREAGETKYGKGNKRNLTGGLRKLKPHSRAFNRGVLGVSRLDGRSVQGKLARSLEFQLTEYIGGNPSIAQKLLIDQAVKAKLQLDMLGEKLTSGVFTETDRRVFGALNNTLRLTLREIGFEASATNRPPSLAALLADMPEIDGGAATVAISKPRSRAKQPSKYRITPVPRLPAGRSAR
jgi:hypothetical protein